LQYSLQVVLSESLMPGQSTVVPTALYAPARTHVAYAPTVTSVVSMSKAATFTLCCGSSAIPSPSADPMRNVPAAR